MNTSSMPQQTELSMNPKKFAFWIFMVTVAILFAAFSSFAIVASDRPNWVQVGMPTMFWISSAIIVLSSVSMQWAFASAKRDHISNLKLGVLITSILAIAFLVSQVLGFRELVDYKVYFTGAGVSPSQSFVYFITVIEYV